MSKFTINVLDPSSPVDPNTPVPDTGLYTNASNTNSSVNVIVPAIVLIVALILLTPVFIKLIRKHSKKSSNGKYNDDYDSNYINDSAYDNNVVNDNKSNDTVENKTNLKHISLIIIPAITLAIIIPISIFVILSNINTTNNKDNINVNNIDTTELTQLERLTSNRNLSISVSANDVNLNVTLDSNNNNTGNGSSSNSSNAKTGVYAVGESTIIINTPTVSGYKLYASVEDADLYLNGDKHDTDHKISAVSNGVEYDEFLSPNTWGISGNPSVVDDPTLQSWFGFPSEPVEIEGSSSATEADHEAGTLYFGTYITPNLVNKDTKEGYGTYSGVTINYIAIANPIAYNIEYNKNTIDDVTDMPSNISDSTYDETITLSSNVPKRANHIFKGWCDGAVNTDTNTDTTTHTDTCDGTIYNPDGSGTDLTYTIDQTISPNYLYLYAMWQETPYTYSVTYDKNTQDEVTNMPENIAETTTYDDFITLSSAIPIRANSETKYKFIGWCTAPVLDSKSCNSPNTKYAPGENYTLNRLDNNDIKLYAMWDSTLWNAVVDEWELGGSRIQTNDTDENTGIKAPITTSNSGVFKYNSTDFGTDTDAEKEGGGKYDIYYFRGILDSDLDGTENTYGSNGDGKLWPNYVKLGDTCWRIVRTTASGGIKMIYNGLYSGGTTANSCANATNDAQVAKRAFNADSNISDNSIIAVGYTFNSDYKTTTEDTPYGELFGTNENYSGNTTDSTIKDYIENTWFASSNGISAYESILEPNAGYCNDRSIYNTSEELLVDNDNIVTPYYHDLTGTTQYDSGAYFRNYALYTSKTPSLGCPRNIADVYTIKTINNNGDVNTYGGNGQLEKPVALLTTDEVSFAGSGYSPSHNINSYLRSGSLFWLLSPGGRTVLGDAFGFDLYSGGQFEIMYVSQNRGVRPAISLASGTTYVSGVGTAVDPWVIYPEEDNIGNTELEKTDPLGVVENNKNNALWVVLEIILTFILLSLLCAISFTIISMNKRKDDEE